MATQTWGRNNPRWVDTILDWRWTWVIAGVALTGPYIVGALMKLSDLHFAVFEQEHFGLYPGLPWALLTIAVEISGPLMIISGRYGWLGAGMLGVFTGLANLLANRFWDMTRRGAFRRYERILRAHCVDRWLHPRSAGGQARTAQEITQMESEYRLRKSYE